MNNNKKTVSTAYAIFALTFVIMIIIGANIIFNAPIHLMFFLIWLAIYPICMYLGYTYEEINAAMMESIEGGLGPILLLMAVGAVIGTWIASGSVPALIYYGLEFIEPGNFLIMAFILCCLVSLACGTSWGTAGTIGIAMFGVGESLGIPSGMTVGVIVSGSYLGDMLSPMSDSTNVAAAAVKTDLFTHCKELSWIALPSIVISGIIYYFLGLQFSGASFDATYIEGIMTAIGGYFNVGLVSFIPVVVLIVLLAMKQPAVPAMLISSIVAAIVAVLYQGVPYNEIMTVMWSGNNVATGQEFLDSLLNRGGVTSMFATAALMMYAFGMIGAFEKTGILDALIRPALSKINNIVKLTAVSQIVALIGNLLGTNTFALLMTGSLMLPAYEEYDLHPTNLSKAINATSTTIAPLIPWNISGLYIFGLFGISVAQYAPYSFICYVTPLLAFLMVAFGFRIVPASVDLEGGEKYVKTKEEKNEKI